ncbi:MAG: serine/threonine protein kinase [Myxococcaceae bacterium]|jgi:hypothetical protein|nr:serine/threonine protein kinase [Myxococcaceae bacterium]MCA3011836.1 serine/threonine protein kinase [Myxococcaceae bacterium]
MPATLEALVAESERRVLESERRDNTRRLVAVRLVTTLAGAAVVAIGGGAPSTLAACVTSLAIGALLFAAHRLTSRFDALLPWAVPLVDVPLVAITELVRLREGAPVTGLIATSACINLGLVVLSALSLAPRIVVATALTGAAAVTVVSHQAGLPLVELDLALVAFAATAAVVTWTTSRVWPLAVELRRQAWAGRYKVGHRLGAGGMAEVFEAQQQREGAPPRRVALKRILPAFASHEDAQRLFLRELEFASLMSHPNIVQVLDSGADEAGPFLVMEYVEGVTLHRLLKHGRDRGERLPADVCFEVADQLLRAVDHIHSRLGADGRPLGLMHRDLNAPNVMVTTAGELKVADFGIARLQRDVGLTGTGEMRGKVLWAAPEQLLGLSLTPALDLFAVGLILVEVALGRHATGEQPPLPEAVEAARPAFPAERPELGEGFWEMTFSLLEPDPARRCPSASAALRLLRHLEWEPGVARAALSGLVAAQRAPSEPKTLTL